MSVANGARGGARALFAALLLGLSATPAAGQDEASRERLEALEAAVDAERRSLEAFRQEWQAELERKRADFEAEAEKLRALRSERRALEERRVRLERRLRQAEVGQSELSEVVAALRVSARRLAERLRLHLGEIPASEPLRERAGDALDLLSRGDESRVGLQDDLREGTATLLQLVATVHDRASRVRISEERIWTAAERREPVSLLSAGHVAFAYRTREAGEGEASDEGNGRGRVGIALASPREASGYRWSESLPRESVDAVHAALAQLRAGRDGTAAVPVDVSRELRASSALRRTSFVDRLRSGGLVMAPLALLALVAVGLALERATVLYRSNPAGADLAERVIAACRAGHLREAAQLCQGGQGAVARTLAAGLAAREAGRRATEDAVQEQILHELPSIQRFLGGLAVLAAVAPLLGLLGTVTGIIETFGVIRALETTEPSLMAGGISEALVTTATGLVLAIPILLVHSLLSSRADRLVGDAESYAVTLVNALFEDEEQGP